MHTLCLSGPLHLFIYLGRISLNTRFFPPRVCLCVCARVRLSAPERPRTEKPLSLPETPRDGGAQLFPRTGPVGHFFYFFIFALNRFYLADGSNLLSSGTRIPKKQNKTKTKSRASERALRALFTCEKLRSSPGLESLWRMFGWEGGASAAFHPLWYSWHS